MLTILNMVFSKVLNQKFKVKTQAFIKTWIVLYMVALMEYILEVLFKVTIQKIVMVL